MRQNLFKYRKKFNSTFDFKQKIRLAQSLLTKSKPAYVQYYVTARCNLSCEQCNIIYSDASAPEMNIHQIQRMAENMAKIGVCIVLLIGGEPFIRQDLPKIVKAFTDVNIHVRLQTNGFGSKKALEECVKNGAHDISISLDTLRPEVQDIINGGYPNSWDRMINTVSTINEIFPKNGAAFFGTVLMPRNLMDIPAVFKFATKIGWGVSLVPIHVGTLLFPRGFRTFDQHDTVTFKNADFDKVRKVVAHLIEMKHSGYNLYDSEEYLNDITRFIFKEPLQWRRRNHNICDSPHLYFAIAPDGRLKPCCDYELSNTYPVFDKNFPEWFFNRTIHSDAYAITQKCNGCMYGSYPEISISARYLKALIDRFLYFNFAPKLQRYSSEEMKNIAQDILSSEYNKNLSI